MLTSDELERYARHIVLADIGGPGQAALKAARVLVIGAGGLGAPVIMYLAAAGVGLIRIVDDDTVSLSNLQRQVIHQTRDIGRPKSDSAASFANNLNAHVTIEARNERITTENAEAVIADVDLVLDGSDNFPTRYLVSDACCLLRKPLVTGAVGQFDGSLTTLRPFEAGEDGTPNPTYRCLFPDPPPDGILPTCAEAGVLGALTGVIGTLMAMEAIKEICQVGRGLVGRLLLYDAKDARFDTLAYRWSPDNPLTGRAPSITDLSIHTAPSPMAAETSGR